MTDRLIQQITINLIVGSESGDGILEVSLRTA